MEKQKKLIIVTGMSPQVVTETLYALITQEDPWIPNQIEIITTNKGKQKLTESLFGPTCQVVNLLKDYNVSNVIKFSANLIHVMTNAAGQAIEDLVTLDANEAAADYICNKIRSNCEEDAELHVSLAGGRKTMGFYTGYALSLFGRKGDTLSHVIINEEYESLPDFYYPTPYSNIIKNRKGMEVDSAKAKVWLVNIPFVRINAISKMDTIVSNKKFSEIIKTINKCTDVESIIINRQNKTLHVNSISVRLAPSKLAFYLWFVYKLKNNKGGIECPYEGEPNKEYAKEYLSVLLEIKKISNSYLKTEETTFKSGMDKPYFEQLLSKTKQELQKSLGQTLYEKITIQKISIDQKTKYALSCAKEDITII